MSESGRIDETINYLNVDSNKNCKYYAFKAQDGHFHALREGSFGHKSNSRCINRHTISRRPYLKNKCNKTKNDELKKQFKESKDRLS